MKKAIKIIFIDKKGTERFLYQDPTTKQFIGKEEAKNRKIVKTINPKSKEEIKKESLDDKIFKLYTKLTELCELYCINIKDPPCKTNSKSCSLNKFYQNFQYHVEMGWLNQIKEDLEIINQPENSALIREFLKKIENRKEE